MNLARIDMAQQNGAGIISMNFNSWADVGDLEPGLIRSEKPIMKGWASAPPGNKSKPALQVLKTSTEALCLDVCRNHGYDTVYIRGLPTDSTLYMGGPAAHGMPHIRANFRYKETDRWVAATIFLTPMPGMAMAATTPVGGTNPKFGNPHWMESGDPIAEERKTADEVRVKEWEDAVP